MSGSLGNTERLYELFAAQVDDQLTSSQRDELEALLLDSTSAQKMYIDLVAQHSELTRIHLGLGPWGDFDIPALNVNTLPTGRADRIWDAAKNRIRHPGFVLATLAATVLFCGLSLWLARERFEPDRAKIAAVGGEIARLAWSDSAVWETDIPICPNLATGERLVLLSGLAELHYKTGVTVILQGPAEFTVGGTEESEWINVGDSDNPPLSNSGYLAHGSLLAWIDGPQSKGFTIETPTTTLEDHGTEFAVQVQDDGATDVVVLSGSVDVLREPDGNWPGQRMRLTTGQAAFVKAGGGKIARRSDVDYRFLAPMRRRLEETRDAPALEQSKTTMVAHWKLDGNAKDTVGSHHGELRGAAGFAVGRLGQAAKFNGDGDFITSSTDPLPRTNFTVSAWLFPESGKQRMYIAGTQQSGNKGAFLMVGYDGVLSAVFPGTDLNRDVRSVTNTVPLRQWTHVAMTVSRTDGLRLYVNGSLVAIEAKMTSQRSVRNFTIGRRPDEPPSKDKYHYWKGLIDDVAVWNGVLTSKQLRNIVNLGAENFNRDINSAATHP